MKKSLIAVPIGDPAGVGPEIVAKAVASKEVADVAGCIIVGDKTIVENAIKITGADLRVHVINEPKEGDFREGILNLIDLGNVDMAGFSGHKIGALKGIAVLYKKPEIQLEPLIYGSQERGLIGGTENTLGIYSLYYAIKTYCDNHIYSSISSYNCKYILNYLNNYVSDIFLLGEPIGKNRLAHNLFLLIKGVDGEQLLTLLDEYNIQVSTGSACNSGSKQPSNTLLELGIPEEYLHSCIRLTFDGHETDDDLDYIGRILVTSISELPTT